MRSFFLKKSYLYFDRDTTLTACILLSAKVNDVQHLGAKYLVSSQIWMNRYIEEMDGLLRQATMESGADTSYKGDAILQQSAIQEDKINPFQQQ